MNDLVEAIELRAAEYRERYRLAADENIEIELSPREALRLRAEHGSLRAAADALFDPGAVTLYCQDWRNTQWLINRAIDGWPPPWRFVPLGELTRIALAYGSGVPA